MSEFHACLHLPKAMQALTVAEMIKNTGIHCHVDVALWCLMAITSQMAKDRRRRGMRSWQGGFAVAHLLPAHNTKALLPAVLFARDRK